jgi:hypothetical protein
MGRGEGVYSQACVDTHDSRAARSLRGLNSCLTDRSCSACYPRPYVTIVLLTLMPQRPRTSSQLFNPPSSFRHDGPPRGSSDLLALEFSDLFRLAENACAHRYGKQKFDARRNRSHNRVIWSRMRYQCATTSKLTSKSLFLRQEL